MKKGCLCAIMALAVLTMPAAIVQVRHALHRSDVSSASALCDG